VGLITYEQLAAFPGFDGVDASMAMALIDAVSSLVQLEAGDVELTPETLPPALVPVIVNAVRRGIQNPLGRSGEQLGDYGWQGGGGGDGSGLYLTRTEKRIIRRAVGVVDGGSWLSSPLPFQPGEPWFCPIE